MDNFSQHLPHFLKYCFFFTLGAFLTALIITVSISYYFSQKYENRIFYGVTIGSVDVSNLTKDEAKKKLILLTPDTPITIGSVSALPKDIGLRPDIDLMSERAFSIGRQNSNPLYNLSQIYSAWQGKLNLPLELTINEDFLKGKLAPLAKEAEFPPVDAVFKLESGAGPDQKGRVVAFSPSKNGIAIDYERIKNEITSNAIENQPIIVPLYTKLIPPTIQSSAAEKYGLHDLLGTGESYFFDSIPGRVYNINLGTKKVSGSLVPPSEIFSFNDSIGTISALFGFQKAYSIVRGKTVLDDGGGVCQVSTTLYRAALNSGLPIIERSAHAYRVGYYEQGGFAPGLDATVYPPNPDFRFKNDTGHWLLLQAKFDENAKKLTFEIFGTSDDRQTKITGPVILSQTPPPEPITEDDPTLPVGQIKQIDTAHYGAKTSFTRTVTRNGQEIISETVISNYIPWPARFLKGTKT